MVSGLTHSSNSCAVTMPRLIAASFNVVPSLCAFLAVAAALSYPTLLFSAVTSMSDSFNSWLILFSFALMPTTQLLVNDAEASAMSLMDCSRELINMGLKTFSSKWPWEPPMVTPTWLPMTCAHTMVRASHCVGLTLPGMILLPGSFSGRFNSPRPHLGPLPSNL